MYEDLVGHKQEQDRLEGVCPECKSKYAWAYPTIRTRIEVVVYFYCPDCGHKWVMDV